MIYINQLDRVCEYKQSRGEMQKWQALWKTLITWCSSSEYTFPTAWSYSVCILRGTQWKDSVLLAARVLQKLDMFSEFETPTACSEPVLPITTGFALWMERVVMRVSLTRQKLGQYCRLCAAANLILWIRCMSSVWHGAITDSSLTQQLHLLGKYFLVI